MQFDPDLLDLYVEHARILYPINISPCIPLPSIFAQRLNAIMCYYLQPPSPIKLSQLMVKASTTLLNYLYC